jgi:hypothetical protein
MTNPTDPAALLQSVPQQTKASWAAALGLPVKLMTQPTSVLAAMIATGTMHLGASFDKVDDLQFSDTEAELGDLTMSRKAAKVIWVRARACCVLRAACCAVQLAQRAQRLRSAARLPLVLLDCTR